jgi:glucose/arabinose dehydrogenase
MQSLARLSRGLVLCSIAAVVASCADESAPLSDTSAAITVPSGFSQTVIATGVSEPTALAFTPDGTLLVTGRGGKVRVIKNGSLLSAAALDLSSRVCPQRERGLVGIAVDPEFASNKYVYLYYTAKKANCDLHSTSGAINRVSRFTYNTSTDKLSSELVLVDHILSYNGWHNGGDLQFGHDGFLYIGVGDSGAKLGTTSTGWGNDNARWKSLLSGKVLRVQKSNGAPAPGNPWINAAGSRRCGNPAAAPEFPRDNNRPCQETFAWGLRNPFRIPFKPGTNEFFINEVGQNIGGDWEEINQGRAGADYGWNRNQGPDVDGSTQAPIYAYEIGEEVGGSACRSITAGSFIPSGAWPSTYEGGYLFGDYVCGVIFYIKRENNRWVRRTFATGLGGSSIVHMAFGPGPGGGVALYYTSFNGSKIVRITGPAGSNNPPTAIMSASRTSGPTPLAVTFDGSDSFDNDPGDGIARYIWNFGDGSAGQTTTTPTVLHTYTARGSFTARLTVEDRRTPVRQGTTTLSIRAGDTPPRVTITAPSPTKEFFVGETLTLSATATDTEDGTLPASALFWEVKKVHDDHTHPYLSQAGNNLPLVPDGPEGLEAAEQSHFLIKVTATDSAGLTAEVEQELQPRRVPITFQTSPPGLRVVVEDSTLVGPTTITSWQGWSLHVDARPQVRDGTSYVWDRWSQGGNAAQEIRTPATTATYTATYRQAAFSAMVNFQLGSAVVPTGYVEDDGAVFGARGGGLRYGWDADNQAAARERNNPTSPDKRYDTTILMQKSANRRWDIEVPNGTYQVKLVAGDANHNDSVFRITAEGALFLSGTPTASNRWIEATGTVRVTDGRLTLDNGTGARNNKVCFVEITATSAP